LNTYLDRKSLDEDLLELLKTQPPELAKILAELVDKLKGRIGLALYENSPQRFESMSDKRRYLPILSFLQKSYYANDQNIRECQNIMLNKRIRIIDACAGEQEAIKSFLNGLNNLIQANDTVAKEVIVDIYDKNFNPSLLISKYELPSSNFELDEASLRDARTEYTINPEEPTICFISYSDLYNSQYDYAQMILNALKVSDIVIILPGTFSLTEEEIIPRIIYKKEGTYKTFLM